MTPDRLDATFEEKLSLPQLQTCHNYAFEYLEHEPSRERRLDDEGRENETQVY